MSHLFIIRGLPGSGKSTLAQDMLAAGAVDAVFEADNYFMVGGVYNFDPAGLPSAHKSCQDGARDMLRLGKRVAVANTFSREWEVTPYKNMGFPYTIIECRGEWPNVHGVPVEVIQRMKDRWEIVT